MRCVARVAERHDVSPTRPTGGVIPLNNVTLMIARRRSDSSGKPQGGTGG
jgi:hypothetical protein